MSSSCAVMLKFHSQRRLWRSTLYLSVGVTVFLVGVGGGLAPLASGRVDVSAGALGLVGLEAGRETRVLCIYFLCSREASARSTLVRALMTCCGLTVVSLNHFRNGITCWVIPIASAFACIMCHTLVGEVMGQPTAGAPGRGGVLTPGGAETLSGLALSPVNLVVPVGRRA